MSLLKLNKDQVRKLGFHMVIRRCKNNHQKLYEYQKNYAKLHPEKFIGVGRKYYQANLIENRKKANIRRFNYKISVITHYSKSKMECCCCKENLLCMLGIDRIDQDNNCHKIVGTGHTFYYWLIKNNFPEGYQVLCFNCNYGRYANNGICPHGK